MRRRFVYQQKIHVSNIPATNRFFGHMISFFLVFLITFLLSSFSFFWLNLLFFPRSWWSTLIQADGHQLLTSSNTRCCSLPPEWAPTSSESSSMQRSSRTHCSRSKFPTAQTKPPTAEQIASYERAGQPRRRLFTRQTLIAGLKWSDNHKEFCCFFCHFRVETFRQIVWISPLTLGNYNQLPFYYKFLVF